MEAEVSNNSLGLNLFCLVNIDDLPSLVGSSMSLPYNNVSVFFIFTTANIKNVVVLNISDKFS
jgi:hypothetical protein